MKLSIIIPCYNEKNTISELLKRVDAVDLSKFNCGKEIIVVDDYSTDGTGDILKNLKDKYKIIHHEKNQGKGGALITGIKEATGDFIIFQDADLELDPDDYLVLLAPLVKNEAEVVLGSRFLNSKFSFNKYYLANKILTLLANLLFFNRISDCYCGYKAFKADVLKSFNLTSGGFEIEAELIANIFKKGYKIKEAPVKYFPRDISEGKKTKFRDAFRGIMALIKFRF